MSEDAENKTQSGRWIIAVAGALTFYVLSYGPVGALAWKSEMPWSIKPVVIFYAPLIWTGQQMPEPGGELMLQYFMWWCDVFHAPFVME